MKHKWKSAAARRLLEMAGNPTTMEEAAQIVAANAMCDIPHPPLDVHALAAKLKVGPVLYEDVPFSGELRPTSDGFIVVCSKHMSPPRQRFTIAHELSHAILERSGPRCPRTGPELERICDMLASELLMPRSVFINLARETTSIDQIFDLSRTFGTSLAATALRCVKLLNISLFQVEKDSVIWGYGVVNKGPTALLDSDLQRLARYGIGGESGSANVRLTAGGFSRPWCVEYRPMNGGRVLFLLRPDSKSCSSKAS